MDRTTATNMNVSSLVNHTVHATKTEEAETAMVDTFMDEVETFMTFKTVNFICTYWMPILVPIGLVGNTSSFLVMIKPNNRKMSIYMAAISINDNIMMFLAFHNWMSSTGYSIMSSIECRFPSFFIAVIWHNGTYQVLAMTIDKYIAIKWPHKASIYSTPERARKTSIVTIICIFIYNIPHLFLSKRFGNDCLGLSVGGVITKVYSILSFLYMG